MNLVFGMLRDNLFTQSHSYIDWSSLLIFLDISLMSDFLFVTTNSKEDNGLVKVVSSA